MIKNDPPITGDVQASRRLPDRQIWLTPSRLFVILSVLGTSVVFICFFFSRGELFSKYFWYDDRDTGMDFLNSITYLKGNRPYEQYAALYPPLANLFFAALYHMVPQSVTDNWGSGFRKTLLYVDHLAICVHFKARC